MTDNSKIVDSALEFFEYYGNKIETKPGHSPVVQEFKSGGGFSCKCTCGKSISRPSGCNRAGFVYAIAATAELFNKHVNLITNNETV